MTYEEWRLKVDYEIGHGYSDEDVDAPEMKFETACRRAYERGLDPVVFQHRWNSADDKLIPELRRRIKK